MNPVFVRKFWFVTAAAVLGVSITLFFVLPVRHAKPSIGETNAPDPNEEEPGTSVSAPEPSLSRVESGTSAQLALLTDEALMGRLRAAQNSEPASAVELAREAIRRFPDSSDAPERASILIHALAQLNRSSEARGEAENMVNYYPDSHWVREVEQFTGAHRHRNVRLDDAGRLEYFDP